MNDQRKLLAAAVALCVQQGMLPNEESIKKVIPQLQQLGPEQFNQLATMGEQLLQQAEQLLKSAKVAALGTKLDYINKLKGVCPEGTEKVYLAKGGCICNKIEKALPGGNLEKKSKESNNTVINFKAKRQENKKLNPKTTKNLPNGKYPSNWDGDDRMVWEREHGSKDEGAHTTKNKGIGKNLCGGKARKHLSGGGLVAPLKPNFTAMAKKPNMDPQLAVEDLKWRRDLPYIQAGYSPDNLDRNMSLKLEEAARSGKDVDKWMEKWAKKNKSPHAQMLYKRFKEMGGPQIRGGEVSSMVGKNPDDIIVTPKPGKMFTIGY